MFVGEEVGSRLLFGNLLKRIALSSKSQLSIIFYFHLIADNSEPVQPSLLKQ